ncbi:MAG: alkene reductase, partial [Ostreibacterium sp.]
KILNAGHADLVAFGRSYVANPDLVARFEHSLPLAEADNNTLFGGTEKGYIDYPDYQQQAVG